MLYMLNKTKIHKFPYTMSPNIPKTTIACGNCQKILARNDKNDGKLSTGISVHSIDESKSLFEI